MIKNKLHSLFLEYYCQYLTVEKFASDNNFTIEKAKRIIEIGKKIHNARAEKEKALDILIDDFKKTNPDAKFATIKNLRYRLSHFTIAELRLLMKGI